MSLKCRKGENATFHADICFGDGCLAVITGNVNNVLKPKALSLICTFKHRSTCVRRKKSLIYSTSFWSSLSASCEWSRSQSILSFNVILAHFNIFFISKMCLFNSTKITLKLTWVFLVPVHLKRQLSNYINYLAAVSQSVFFFFLTLKTPMKFGSIPEVFLSSDLAGHTTR